MPQLALILARSALVDAMPQPSMQLSANLAKLVNTTPEMEILLASNAPLVISKILLLKRPVRSALKGHILTLKVIMYVLYVMLENT